MHINLRPLGVREFMFFALLLHLVYGIYQAKQGRYYLKDSYEYEWAAKNLLNEGILYSGDRSLPERMDYYSKRPPVYPLFLLACLLNPWVVIFVQSLLSLFNLFLAYKILKQLLPDEVEPNFGLFLLLLAWYPAQAIYTQLIMTEILFQTEICLMVYCLLRAQQSRHIGFETLYTLLLMAAMLTKPIMYLFALLHIVGMVFWAWKYNKKFVYVLVFLPLLTVQVYSHWNENRTGYWHFSTIQTLSLFQYTSQHVLNAALGEENAVLLTDSVWDRSLQIKDFKTSQELLLDFSNNTLKAYPKIFVLQTLKGMLNFFLDPGRFDLYHFWGMKNEEGEGLQRQFSAQGYQGLIAYILKQPWQWVILLPVLILGNALRWVGMGLFAGIKSVPLEKRLIIGIFILYLAGLTGTSGASRFAVPVFPLTMVGTIAFLQIRYLRLFRPH